MWKAAAACSVARDCTRTALMIFAPVRRATSPQNAGPSSPCSCTSDSPAACTARSISSSARVDEHAGEVHACAAARRRSAAPRRARSAAASRPRRSSRAPRRRPRRRGGRRRGVVMPQCLIRVATPSIVERDARPWRTRAVGQRAGRTGRRRVPSRTSTVCLLPRRPICDRRRRLARLVLASTALDERRSPDPICVPPTFCDDVAAPQMPAFVGRAVGHDGPTTARPPRRCSRIRRGSSVGAVLTPR